MAYTVHIREMARHKIAAMAEDMSRWETKERIDDEEADFIRKAIRGFAHTATAEPFNMGGVDGSGDYPSFSYADSFVYVASASGTMYRTDATHGLVEVKALDEPNLEFVWLPENTDEAMTRWLAALEALAGRSPLEVIQQSDYRELKNRMTHQGHTAAKLLADLILPRASDAANVGIQLRSTAELGAALRLITGETACRYVLMDTTFSLPMVTRRELSLFYEHLKRLCCVEARARGIGFFALSKSHGLPAMDLIEGFAADALGLTAGKVAEHWFMRLPVPGVDAWKFSLAEGRSLPPVGAVSYLFRLHKNTPVLRLDMDREFWESRLQNDPAAEAKVFADLDYCGHDQRAYGYPYPIKACHDRARLSEAERTALKKQIMDAAVAAGMKRHLFRDVSAATGHL